MAKRDSRAGLALARRLAFHQQRINAATEPVDTLHAGSCFLAAVVKAVAEVNPRKADEIVDDTVQFMLRQANAHAMHAMHAVKGAKR